MKIIASTPDYYDYVAHLFGGGDPKLILNRTKFEIPDLGNFKLKINYHPNQFYNDPNKLYIFNWLVLLGKLYLIYRHTITNDIGLFVNNEDMMVKLTAKRRFTFRSDPYYSVDSIFNAPCPTAVKLCKLINKPYFIIDNNNYPVDIWPNLGNLGFSRLVSPDQMYQNISLFLGEQLYNIDEIQIIDNNVKIDSHGFDRVYSFRSNRKLK